jgi:ribosomal protein S27AE
MVKPMKVMDFGKGLRKAFYEDRFFLALFIPIAVVFLYWGIVAGYFIFGDTPGNTSWGDVGWFSLFLFLIVFCLSLSFAVKDFRLGASFHCPHCGQFIPHNQNWTCGACAYTNTPDYKQGWYNHLFRSCGKCHSIPPAVLCTNKVCGQWITLVPGPFRLPVGHNPAPPEHPEIAQLRQQQEVERVKRQFQEEVKREERRARAKQMSSDLEILADKISTTKQFELEALTMVTNLKVAGTLDAYEERVLLEMIKDKVLEEFHVDRRGGRQRYHS